MVFLLRAQELQLLPDDVFEEEDLAGGVLQCFDIEVIPFVFFKAQGYGESVPGFRQVVKSQPGWVALPGLCFGGDDHSCGACPAMKGVSYSGLCSSVASLRKRMMVFCAVWPLDSYTRMLTCGGMVPGAASVWAQFPGSVFSAVPSYAMVF